MGESYRRQESLAFIRPIVSAFPAETNRLKAFRDWILEHCGPDSNVLEIGAGHGKHPFPGEIRERVGRLVGVDPDPAISQNPFMDERYQCSLEEYVARCSEEFQCAYAYMVIEHLSNPASFFKACRRILAPGGYFFAATPNILHYFALVAKGSELLGIQDLLLKLMVGAEQANSYHFRGQYRVNRITTITKYLSDAGFSEVEFRMLDNPVNFEWYLPKALGVLPRLYSRCVYRLRQRNLMGTIMFKARC